MSAAPSNISLYDNFESGIYDLPNEAISPDGKWISVDNGYGAMGVRTDKAGNNIFFLSPKAAHGKNETFSSLVTSAAKYSDFNLTLDVRTDKQLRLKSSPNDWEVAWVLFRYTDVFHYYWLILKPDGVELGKKDCSSCTDPVQGQVFLKRLSHPTLKINNWSTWNISAIKNHIVVDINGSRIIDYIDRNASADLSKGSIALYSEDAIASFDNVHVTPLKKDP
jgi:hypothetical protein